MFLKKAVLKNFAIFTGKHVCWNLFFNKNASLQGPSFIKKRLEKFLRTPILKNICERLLLRVSLEPFSIWSNNMKKWRRRFLKNETKQKPFENSAIWKILPCQDVLYHFVFLFFSTSRLTAFVLHNKRWYYWMFWNS